MLQSRGIANPEISVGNLSTRRDYTDVRDVARAYRLIATAKHLPKNLIYNICSGVSYSGEEILEYIVEYLDISMPKLKVDPSLIRPNDIADIRGDNTLIKTEYDWQPKYSIKQTIQDYLSNR